ncbi:hypothetical protein IFM89_017951 [Coptis chinensis]|uniref:Aminotransferase-like plant mobile domain-containing protein n=1 Tax=Coptis chinensis TaxID=261450 RepID=A0A835HYD4_9MAGN|nr:hypothetical protein IFM89_017951 [Coptis chinensis]
MYFRILGFGTKYKHNAIVVEDHIEEDENVELEEEHDEEIEVSNGQEENLQQVDNVELEEEHDEEIDVSNGQEENLHQFDENESDGESKLGIYSGGPIDSKVLVDYEDHIARKIWAGKGHVTLEWLRKTFSNTPEDATAEIVDCHVRAYLLFLLGCTIFNDKSGVGVHVAYLQVLLEVDNVSKYAWGVAVLAYLYKELAKASQRNGRQVTGCMTLLEAWVYEYFRLQNSPMINMDFKRDMPRMRRWMVYPSLSMATMSSLIYFREEIDLLSAREVYWDPYEDVRDIRPLDDVTFFNDVLCVLDIAEGYNINRVLRQVGYVQKIPGATRLHKESLDIGGTQDVHGMLAREKMIYNILQFKQIIQESSQSGGGGENSGDVGENSGGGQDNGGDGGENSGDNMDIDTTKLTKRQLAMRQKRKK